jgi:hypothetical protein
MSALAPTASTDPALTQATLRSPQEHALAGLLAAGHGRDACATYLRLTNAALMERVIHLDLPTPQDKPIRCGHGPNAWALQDVHHLIDAWLANHATRHIATALGRAPRRITDKARWLGLYKRDRRTLIDVLPQCKTVAPIIVTPPAEPKQKAKRQEIVWTENLEDELAERWFGMQHHSSIARDMGLSPSTVASKAYRLELPRRDAYFLLADYAPGNRARHAHLFPTMVKRRCKVRGHWFWAPRNGAWISREAKKGSEYQSQTCGYAEDLNSSSWLSINRA